MDLKAEEHGVHPLFKRSHRLNLSLLYSYFGSNDISIIVDEDEIFS